MEDLQIGNEMGVEEDEEVFDVTLLLGGVLIGAGLTLSAVFAAREAKFKKLFGMSTMEYMMHKSMNREMAKLALAEMEKIQNETEETE